MTLRGTVVRCGAVRPLVTAMSFSCAKCGAVFRVDFADGVFAPPTGCATAGCRARAFAPMRGTAASVDWRKLRIQARRVPGDPSRDAAEAVTAHLPGFVRPLPREGQHGSCPLL